MESKIDRLLSGAVQEYRSANGVTAQFMAGFLNINRSSFNDRVRGTTPWRLSEADDLARMGVDVPALGSLEVSDV